MPMKGFDPTWTDVPGRCLGISRENCEDRGRATGHGRLVLARGSAGEAPGVQAVFALGTEALTSIKTLILLYQG
jgi:hypothetical protein